MATLFPTAPAKNPGVILSLIRFSHTPHRTHQEILLILLPKHTQNLTTSLHFLHNQPQASLACIIGKSANGLSYLLSLSISCYHPSSQEDLVKPDTRELQVKMKVFVAQLCPTPCDPMDFSLPGFSVQGILQARILGWVTISFSRGYSQPRDRTRFFTVWATREAQVVTKSPQLGLPWWSSG